MKSFNISRSPAKAAIATIHRPSLTAILGTFFVVFALVIAGGTVAMAQVDTGQIGGTVLDQTGAVVPNAAITVTNLATNVERRAVSSTTGAYLVAGLEPAEYQLTVTAVSFKAFNAKVEVTVGGHITLDAKLSVNATTTEIEVVGEGGAQVNTQTQELSQVVDTQQLAELPSLTRNPYDFVTLSGNISSGDNTGNSSNSGQNLTNRGVGFAINGQRESGTEILLDGVENVAIFGVSVGQDVPVDAVQEYSVITNNFSAEYGRASGGVVNLTTKAGTNSIHGSAWEFNRLSAYTANTYGNNAANYAAGSVVAPKGEYTRNQFGYQAGGPILKNKIFIFESTEWTRVRSAASLTEEIFDPTFIAMMPANVQSYYKTYGQTTLPTAGVASTYADLEAADVAQNGAKATVPNFKVNGATAIPGATPVFDWVHFTAPFDAGGGIPENQYTLVGRLDYNPTDKTQMYFRGGREGEDQFVGSASYSAYPQYDVGTAILNQSYLYSLSHTFSPNLFLGTKVSYTRYNNNTSFNTALTGTPNLMFVSPTDPNPNAGGTIQMPGLENASEPGEGGVPVGGPQNTIQFEPDLSWTKDKHSFHFGGLYTYIQLDYAYGAYAQAVEQLGPNWQGSLEDMMNNAGGANGATLISFQTRVNPQGQLPCPIDTSYTDGNFGVPTTGASCAVQTPVSPASYGRSYRYNDWAIYGQDSYKVTARLTLNYGARWEHYGVQHNNKANLDSNFYFGSGSGLEQQVRSGEVEIADKSAAGGFWKPRWGTISPRVGFAYDVFGNARDSVRGGFGISYERNFGNVTYNASFNPPASAVISDACGTGDASCVATVTNDNLGPLGESTGTNYLPPVELRHMDQNIEVSQTQFWSLALQHQLTPGTVVEIGYSGAVGRHLYDLANVNQQGAGQYYLGDPNAVGDLCAGAGVDNLNVLAQLEAQNDPNASEDASECLTRPNPQYTNVNMRGSAAGSSYNGLNVRFQTQNLRLTGLSLSANYTWSHTLDELSSTFGDSLQGGSGYVGSLGYTSLADPRLDWGSADFDVRQRLSFAPIWETPWFKHNGPMVEREALGGWGLSGIYTARTGVPFTVYDYTFDQTFYTVPRLEPATPFSSYHVSKNPQTTGPNQFNGLAVPNSKMTAPYSSELGISDLGPFPTDMMRRNSLRGPGGWYFDAALHKTFPVTERVGLEFGAESIDLFNHHNFYVNTTTLGGPGGNVVEERGGLGSTATGGNHDERRYGQFSLRATF
jgi:hypothetical protein